MWLLAVTVTFFASLALLVLAVLGLGGIVPVILLVVWFTRPQQRRPYLRWLIVIMTPFGLLIYHWVRWSLWGPLIVLEPHGPGAALQRSGILVRGRWFQAAVAYALASGVTLFLSTAPWLVAALVLQALGITDGISDPRPFAQLILLAVANVTWVVLAPILPISLTLLTLHLRNAREGTDLADRLRAPEQVTAPAA
jgi:hypothetical protein